MKKALFGMFLVFVCGGLFAQQPVVAVAPFDAISGINATEANMITRVFFIRLGNTNKVSLVDRSVVERVLREHSFQAGDWSDQKKTAELGTALNADWIVRGEMEKFGSNILVTVQFYDIKTFRFMGGADLRLANADEAYDKMDPLVDKLVETISNTPSVRVTQSPSSSPSGTYNIGDRGPGGGIIFSIADGRYMECSGELGVHNWSRAISVASNYQGGGFTDWRLPTKEELDFMYVNLRITNLEIFIDQGYWSSSVDGSNDAYFIEFNNGNLRNPSKSKSQAHGVRAVRSFLSSVRVAPTISSSQRANLTIGDRGPGGGIIFSIAGGRYIECSGELGRHNWARAVSVAKSYQVGGFTDWRLPTKEELDSIYVNLKIMNLGGFLDQGYWSSSVDGSNDAYFIEFNNGNLRNPSKSKSQTHGVRAVRAF
jgi:TolB-like protein